MNDLDNIQHKFCVAPMMDKTDRHCRYFHRLMSNRAFLYTEMLHSNAVIRGNKERLLKYNPREHPLAIQLGGCDPVQLGEASAISEEFGYTEVNLNVGCPSSKVELSLRAPPGHKVLVTGAAGFIGSHVAEHCHNMGHCLLLLQ